MISEIQIKELIVSAVEARENAYAPFSKFKVGAALLTKNNNIYCGCNVENSSYGGTICAERVAACTAVANGEKVFDAIAIVYDKKELAMPCGICRQFLYEFNPELIIISANLTGGFETKKLSELLPEGFRFEI